MTDIPTDIKRNICNTIKTKDRADNFIIMSDGLVDILGHANVSLETLIDQKDYLDLMNDILKSFGSDLYSLESGKRNEIIRTVRNYVSTLPIIDIELSFVPSNELVNSLYAWFLNNNFGDFILHFSNEGNIKVGLSVSWQGRYVNLSLEHVLQNYFIEKKDVIEGLLY